MDVALDKINEFRKLKHLTIEELSEKSNVPIFTSEAGLVSRGAVASYGADFYRWGYQSGEQASNFLKN